ncbi:MAG TPA: cytochrome c oxidase subunit II [Nitrososphaerales archaeon]|nr:cytochrome c oxidase subunit II [Nitrososphaerales archaeon]
MLSVILTVPPTTATFDFLFSWYLVSGIIAGGFVVGLLLFFAVKYRAREGAPAPSRGPESLWVVLAVVVIMAVALGAAGYQTFASATNIEIPTTPNSVTIKVTAFQWGWNFTYPNGHFAIDNLTVPAGRVVILNITSRDVYHTLGIPMLAVKEDAIPGKVNQLWFEVPDAGVYKDAIHCFELCGVGHAFMIANLTVVSQPAWNAWMSSG